MKIHYYLSVLLISLAIFGAANVSAQVIDITPEEAQAMIDENQAVTVVDVSPAYASGHIPGALNLNVSDGELLAALTTLDKNATYIIYCHTDEASNLGSELMAEAGFTNVYRIRGNFGAWQDAGYETATPAYTDVTAETAKSLIDTNPALIVIDVSPVYTSGHIPDAISLPVGDETLARAAEHLDRNGDYLVYCHSDAASILGAQTLVDVGFTRVKRLQGNYSAWTGAGYPAESSTNTYTDISPADANTLLGTNPETIVIDLSPHWADGHLPGAHHFYFGDGSLHAAVPALSKDAEILAYCHTDEVSMAGAQVLADAGFTNVKRLAGNYSGWVDGGFTVETPMYTDISAADAKALIDGGNPPVVIDVSPAYRDGHVPGSVNLYIGDGTLDTALPFLNPNAEYLVYCHVDAASIPGAQKLVDAGFTQVMRLDGNYGAWTGAGYDVALPPPEYHDISAHAANELIEDTPDIVIIDVSPLYDSGHIPGAVNYPFGTGAFESAIPDFDSEATYLIYCHTDAPAQGAAEALDEAGFESVFRLRGNYAAWVDAGFETSVASGIKEPAPTAFRLTGAFPNPFNPATNISFELPESGITTLTVYDTLGRKVAELFNANLGAGSHTIRWNGIDGSGNRLASGMYIIRLTSSGMTDHIKVSLLK